KEKTHPSKWNVDEVVEWVRGKGFGEDVCAKFTEQEITGDVLLELDVNLLKNEIGIMAFGKRVHIANAIAELRR
ncbi:sterile alpha motif/pointed domain-containing protein, partial [Lentinula edodes]